MKSTAAEINATILDEMQSLFQPPRGCDDVQKTLTVYVKHLRDFRVDQLEAGWNLVVETHEYQRWPAIAYIRECILKAIADQDRTQRQTELVDHKAREDLVETVMRSEIGQQACREMWGYSLYLHVLEHGTTPDLEDQEQYRKGAVSFEQLPDETFKTSYFDFSHLRATVIERERKTAEKYLIRSES